MAKLNIQNQVKVAEYLECYVAREGYVILQKDYAALEPTVLAHLSGCPRYQELYGPKSNPNQDVYLYVGSKFPQFKHFLDYYDPDNPTAEGRDECKKLFKGDRAICKEFHLACLAEGTLVRVKDKGFQPIEEVRKGSEVWDGFAWVPTDGVIFKGVKDCITLEDTLCTPDHKFLTEEGWHEAGHIRKIQKEGKPSQQIRPNKPSATWADVWEMVCSIWRCAKA